MGLLVPLNNDRGALTGIEQGINNYFEAFDRAKDKKEQAAKAADAKKMQMKMSGLIQDESGEYGFDEDTMAKREMARRQDQGQYESGLLSKGMLQGEDGNIGYTPDEMKNQDLRRRLIESQINKNYREKSIKEKALSAVQAKQLGLYKSGQLAEDQYKDATSNKKNYDPTSSGQFIDNSEWAPNFLKNNNAIKAQAAQSAWIEAFLRDASGAAIPPSERGAYARDFFPQPGDPADVVANKAALRAQKMENSKTGSGLIPRGLINQQMAPQREEDLDQMSDAELEAYLRGQ